MPTFAHRLAIATLLLGCTALSGSAQAGWFDSGTKTDTTATDRKPAAKGEDPQAATLEDSIRQAQLLRLAGQYPEAIKHLSQLMMVASDDGRVISEYGKTLAVMGRAQEALNFLGRAQQLQPTDWTVYSALGVAYDQLGKQPEAMAAYEHALTLKPGEPSVLNNYALSRMLAKDPDGARKLIARAESAGGASDPKIARNIAMIRDMAPDAADRTVAVAGAVTAPPPANAPSSAPAPKVAVAPQTAPRVLVRPMAPVAVPQAVASNQTAPFVNIPQPPTAAPRQLVSNPVDNSVIQSSAQLVQPTLGGVVMQRVPVDPLAGPVLPRAAHVARAAAPKAEAPKVEKQAAQPAPVKTAAREAQDLQAKADAIAKTMAGKPQAIAAAKVEANKPTAVSKPAPKAVTPTPAVTKTADAKPVPIKTAAKVTKDNIPGLRLSANAY